MALLAVGALCGCSGSSSGATSSGKAENILVSAKIDTDDNAHIALVDGTNITINDSVEKACITKDRKTIVVLLKDGTLYTTDKSQNNKKIIAENASNYRNVRNEGLIYTDKDKNDYRVLFFENDAILPLGNTTKMTVANDTLTILYSDKDGGIYSLPLASKEPSKIGISSNLSSLNKITNDGTIAVWTEKERTSTGRYSTKYNNTIRLSENGETEILESFDSSESDTSINISSSKDDKLFTIFRNKSSELFIKKPGESTIKVSLGANLADHAIRTESGALYDENADKVKTIYAAVSNEKGYSLYAITPDGERERILTGISSYDIENGRIFYIADDNALNTGKISRSKLTDESKIASSAGSMVISNDGNYVCYARSGENTGAYYCFKIGDKEPKKIAADINSICGFSTDGSAVYYLKDCFSTNSSHDKYGTLYRWSYKDEESAQIATDVLKYSVTSHNESFLTINDKSFVYEKYETVKDKKTISSLYRYDGKESTKMADSIFFSGLSLIGL